jgi:hypothetical protein
MSATIDQLHRKAKAAITAGEARFREAADYLGEARKLGATQRQSAKAIGKSPAWVNRLLRWRDGGCKNTPFGPQSKAQRARVQAVKQKPRLPTTTEQVAKWEAQKARAEAVVRLFGANISNGLRAQLIAALETLTSAHPIERTRARLGMTWDQLIVPAAAESEAKRKAA